MTDLTICRSRYFIKAAVFLLVATLLPVQSGYSVAAEKIKVSYLSPALDRPFWQNTYDLMQAAADDLDIELTPVFTSSNYRLTKAGLTLLNAKEKPDYFVTSFLTGIAAEMLSVAEKKQIKSLIINGAIPDADKEFVGLPRGKFKNWLGLMYPDDNSSSFLLARYLLEQGRKNSGPGNIKVIGLNGEPENSPAINRNLGFRRALKAFGDADLVGAVNCDWDREVGKAMALQYLEEDPEIDVIWTASDEIALGALTSIHTAGLKPGKDIVIGGFDWSPEALQKIQSGEMSASMGGHFIEAAFALILIHDYQHGIDFSDDPGLQHQTIMQMVTAENVEHYIQLLSQPDWNRIDFKQFSKVYNKSLEKYDFSFETIAKQLMHAGSGKASD